MLDTAILHNRVPNGGIGYCIRIPCSSCSDRMTGFIRRLKNSFDTRSPNDGERRVNARGILKHRDANQREKVEVFLWLYDGEKERVLHRVQGKDELNPDSSQLTLDGSEEDAQAFVREFIGDSFYNFHFCDVQKSIHVQSKKREDLTDLFQEFITNYDEQMQVADNLDLFAEDAGRYIEDAEKKKISQEMIESKKAEIERAHTGVKQVPYPQMVFYEGEQMQITGRSIRELTAQREALGNCGYQVAVGALERLVHNEMLKKERSVLRGIEVYWRTKEATIQQAVAAGFHKNTDTEGRAVYSYYMYDLETDTMDAEPFVTVERFDEIPEFKLGAMIDESPFGLYADSGSDDERVAVILPLSALQSGEETLPDLSVKINDYEVATTYLQDKNIAYDDLLASEKQARDMILMINVFSYGFILMISLISVANVFNTITTNIALRRRDFGMLRSVGMKTGELYRMIGVECLSYGGRALLWGLPLSLLINYGVQMIATNVSNDGYTFPFGTVAIAVVSVFLIVFITMFYAVRKLRKDNPIDAIRMENI